MEETPYPRPVHPFTCEWAKERSRWLEVSVATYCRLFCPYSSGTMCWFRKEDEEEWKKNRRRRKTLQLSLQMNTSER